MIRRLAREVALQALFQIDFKHEVELALAEADAPVDEHEEAEAAVEAAMDEHEELLAPEAVDTEEEIDKALDRHKELGAQTARERVRSYALLLVNGVMEHLAEIDSKMSEFATDWSVERMPATDRNILRVAVFEMLHEQPALPAGVAINEAVEIAKSYGTDESPRFINGVLGKLAKK